jgi:hypothetical protein
VSSGILHSVALVKTDISEELSASMIRATRIGELGTSLAETGNLRRLLVTANSSEGGDKFLRNVGSNKSHTA